MPYASLHPLRIGKTQARPPTSIFARAQSSVAVQNEPRAAHDARASGAVIERQAGGSGQDQHWLERWVAAATTPTPIPVRATQKMATASPDGPVMEMSTPTTPLPWAVDTADREEQRAMEAEMEHVNQQLASLAAKYGARAGNVFGRGREKTNLSLLQIKAQVNGSERNRTGCLNS